MSVELKTYTEGNKTFLAVGYIEDRESSRLYDEVRYLAENASGKLKYTDDYQAALDFIAEGLNPPRNYTL
jgi:hypothetical protein